MVDDDSEPIIINLGSGTLKAGFASDDAPKCIFPMVIGKPLQPGILVGMDQKEYYVGVEAIQKKSLLKIDYPIVEGQVTDIAHMREIFTHLFNNELRISPEEHKIMITEPPNNPKENREALTELMFTEFKVPKLYLGNQAVLSLFATGKTTGTVLDAGDGITHSVPIYEGYAIPHAIRSLNMAGNDLTRFLHDSLTTKHPELFQQMDPETIWQQIKMIKESRCVVAQDFDAELKTAQEQKG